MILGDQLFQSGCVGHSWVPVLPEGGEARERLNGYAARPPFKFSIRIDRKWAGSGALHSVTPAI